MMQTVLSIATLLGGVAAVWYFWDRFFGKESSPTSFKQKVWRTLRLTPGTLSDAVRKSPDEAVRFLLAWLQADQDREGHHFGQFGSGANMKEERHYQTGREVLSVKPRLYLTGWPCFILKRYGLAAENIELAHLGVRRLLEDGVVHVVEGALPEMHPSDRPNLVSYRHTLRAVQILLELREDPAMVADTLGQILDSRGGWQNADGGWAQCDRVITGSDLWGSAYAAALLFALTQRGCLERFGMSTVIAQKLKTTVDFLCSQWRESRWRYAALNEEQNAPQLFHEVAACLRSTAPNLQEEVVRWLKGWITPSGTLSRAYMAKCKDLSVASANARIAYALYLADEPLTIWRTLYETAVNEFGQGQGVNSADVAFLLELTQVLRNTDQDGVRSL